MNNESMEGKNGLELLALGRRHYIYGEYTEAVACLSRSSELLVEEHKDKLHNTLGNVYLYYGKSLLQLARAEGDPLGEGVPKEVGMEAEGSEDDDVSDDDDDNEDEDGDEGENEGDESTVGENGGEADTDEKEKVEAKADISINGEAVSSSAKDAADNADESMSTADESKNTLDDSKLEEAIEDEAEGGEGDSGDKEEEPSDLELAWEALELSKIILERRGDEGKEDFAECLITLGEVSLESENFESAIADITAGVAIQKEIFTKSEDKRKLAEGYYKLGLALAAHNKIEESVKNYNTTLEILQDRLKDLEALPEIGSSDAEDIKEIKTLIPDLEDKIADLKSFKDELAAKKAEEEAPVLSSPEKKATNISHLVKRKRKLDTDDEGAGNSNAKKPPV